MYVSVIFKKFLKIKPKLLCPFLGEEGEIRRSEVQSEEEFLFFYSIYLLLFIKNSVIGITEVCTLIVV